MPGIPLTNGPLYFGLKCFTVTAEVTVPLQLAWVGKLERILYKTILKVADAVSHILLIAKMFDKRLSGKEHSFWVWIVAFSDWKKEVWGNSWN